jgi:hypothetical protein
MNNRFIEGSRWELTVDANCIPAGCYTFVERQDEFLMFQVSPDIQFALAAQYYLPYLKEVTGSGATKTTPDDFLESYFFRIRYPSPEAFGIDAMSFCVMAPKLTAKFYPNGPLVSDFV